MQKQYKTNTFLIQTPGGGLQLLLLLSLLLLLLLLLPLLLPLLLLLLLIGFRIATTERKTNTKLALFWHLPPGGDRPKSP